MRRRDRSDGGQDFYNDYERGYAPDNNFDRAYDSTAYSNRQDRDYKPNYQDPRDMNGYRDPRDNGYSDHQPPRRPQESHQYRPMEDMQLHQRDVAPKYQEAPPTEMSGANNVVVSYPKTYQEVKQLIESMRLKQAIIIDIIKLDGEDAQRVLDFLSGANYALGGSMQRLSATMFLFTPGGVPIKIHYDVNKKK